VTSSRDGNLRHAQQSTTGFTGQVFNGHPITLFERRASQQNWLPIVRVGVNSGGRQYFALGPLLLSQLTLAVRFGASDACQ